MAQLLSTTEARIMLAIASLAIVSVIAYYIVVRVRKAYMDEDTPLVDDLMGNVRDLYAEGELSEEEYRAIRSQMATRMIDRLNRKRSEE